MSDTNGLRSGSGSGTKSIRGSGVKNTTTAAWSDTNVTKSPPRRSVDAAGGMSQQQQQQLYQSSPSSPSPSTASVTHPHVENSPSPLRPIRLTAHAPKNYEPYVEEEDEEEGGMEGEEDGDVLADSLGGPGSQRPHHRNPQSSVSVPLAPVLVRASQMTHATQNTADSFGTAASAAVTGDIHPLVPILSCL